MEEKTNILLLVTSNTQHETKNRNGDLYRFGKDIMNYMGSSTLLADLNFIDAEQLVPNGRKEVKPILEIIGEEQFDELWSYIPYVKDDKLIIPLPLSEKRAISFNFRYYDCTGSGSTVFPEIISLGDKITRIITVVCDREKPNHTNQIYSHWTYIDGEIKPALMPLQI